MLPKLEQPKLKARFRAVFGRTVRAVLLGCGLVLLIFLVVGLADGWTSFGVAASGERLERMKRSPQWRDGSFHNPQPIVNDNGAIFDSLFHRSEHGRPNPSLHFDPVDQARLLVPPTSGLRVTWLGHSTTLIEIDGHRVLTDPIWSERASPLAWLGPTRWFEPLIPLSELRDVEAVIISHDHYDHLDRNTVVAMKDWDTKFVVPLGVGAHLEAWGIPLSKIVELDWWERVQLGDMQIVCTPARHASGRWVFDRDQTLWASYAILGPQHRVYFSGDTGLFPAMQEIGERFGPFDLTMIEVGQYNQAWPDWHIGPEQAVVAHQLLRGRALLPVHWALFQLASHGWTEPVERTSAEAHQQSVRVLLPKPGESIEPTTEIRREHWWPNLPWETGRDRPIVSKHGLPGT